MICGLAGYPQARRDYLLFLYHLSIPPTNNALFLREVISGRKHKSRGRKAL